MVKRSFQEVFLFVSSLTLYVTPLQISLFCKPVYYTPVQEMFGKLFSR